ncbi:MAG: AtzE family amidohydrolase, partial [Myxococcota bacterium]
FGAKDLFDVRGRRTRAGSVLREHAEPAAEDSAAVSFLRGAGSVLLGHQNMDEFAYGFTTENVHTGPTRNPHDRTRVAGGSSGGSAAATAAGMCHVALGSDTNGSVRVPASFCGLFGLKPTFSRVSRRGVFPFVHSLDHVGAFARHANDLAAVFDALSTRDPRDPGQTTRTDPPALPTLEDEETSRIAVLGGFFERGATPAATGALRRVAEALGATETVEVSGVEQARSAAFVLSGAEGGSLHLPMLREQADAYDPAVRDRLLAGATLPAHWLLRAQRFRRVFRDRFTRLFDQFDILLAPATPFTAPRIGETTIELRGEEVSVRANAGLYTQPLSFIGVPIVVVPVWPTEKMPIGVQLIGAPWSEAALLRAAHRLETLGTSTCKQPGDLL